VAEFRQFDRLGSH